MDVLDVFSDAACGVAVVVLDKLQWLLEQPVHRPSETPLPSPRSVLPSVAVSLALTADEFTPLPPATSSVTPAVPAIAQTVQDSSYIISSCLPILVFLALVLFVAIIFAWIVEKEVEHPTFLDTLEIAISDVLCGIFARMMDGVKRYCSRAHTHEDKAESSPPDDEDDPMYVAAAQPPPPKAYHMVSGTQVEGQQEHDVDPENLQTIAETINAQFVRLRGTGKDSLDGENGRKRLKKGSNWRSTVETHTNQSLALLEPHLQGLPPMLATFYRDVVKNMLQTLKYQVLFTDKRTECDDTENGLERSQLWIQGLEKDKQGMENQIEKRVGSRVQAIVDRELSAHTQYCDNEWTKAMKKEVDRMEKEIEMRVESTIKASLDEASAAHAKESEQLLAQHIKEEKQDREKEVGLIKACYDEVVALHDQEVCELKEQIAALQAASQVPPPSSSMPVPAAAPLPVIDEAAADINRQTPPADPTSPSSQMPGNGQALASTLHSTSAVARDDQLPVEPPKQPPPRLEVSTPSTTLDQAPAKSGPPTPPSNTGIDLRTFLNITNRIVDAYDLLLDVVISGDHSIEDTDLKLTEWYVGAGDLAGRVEAHRQYLLAQLQPQIQNLAAVPKRLVMDLADIAIDGAHYQGLYQQNKQPTSLEMAPITIIADQPPTEATLLPPQRPNGIDNPTLLSTANVVINCHDGLVEVSEKVMDANDELQDNLWAVSRDGQPCTVDNHRHDLLQKLEPHLQNIDAGLAQLIKTWASLTMDGPTYRVLYANKKKRSKTGWEKEAKRMLAMKESTPFTPAGPSSSSSMSLQTKQLAKLLSKPLNVTTSAAAGNTTNLAPTQNRLLPLVPHAAPSAFSGAAAQFHPLLNSFGVPQTHISPTKHTTPAIPFGSQASGPAHPCEQMPPLSGAGHTAKFTVPQDRPAPGAMPPHMSPLNEGNETMETRAQSPEEVEASDGKSKAKIVCKLPPAPTLQQKQDADEKLEQEQAQTSIRAEAAPLEPAAPAETGPGAEQVISEAALFVRPAAVNMGSRVEQRMAEAALLKPVAAVDPGPGAEQSRAEAALFAAPAAATTGSTVEQRMAEVAPFAPTVALPTGPRVQQGTAETAAPPVTPAAPKPEQTMKDSMWAS